MEPSPAGNSAAGSLEASPKELSLPLQVATRADVGRLVRELAELDDQLHQLGLRTGGSSVKMPKTSLLMDKLTETNSLNLLKKEDRQALQNYLDTIHDQAPVVHISFSADPTPAFLDKLVSWFRREIDPALLLTIGLQPTIGAGCIIRTTNHYFDFSLRSDFAGKRDMLVAGLKLPGQNAGENP